MKTAQAIRTGPESYSVRFGKIVRQGVRYRFLLALVRAGYRVRLCPDGWGGRTRILVDAG